MIILTRTVIIALGVIMVLAGCASPPPGPSPTTPAPASETPSPDPARYAGPGKPRLELTDVWQNDDQPLINLGAAVMIKDSLVITGENETLGDRDTAVIDADSGKVRWRAGQLPREFELAAKGKPMARLSMLAGWAVDAGRADGMLILPYHLGPCRDGSHACSLKDLKPYRERGLVGFSLADHRQVWHTAPIRSAAPKDGGSQTTGFQTLAVVGATDTAVLVTVGVAGNEFADLEWDAPDRRPTTIAYETALGREQWRVEGFVAEQVLVSGVLIGLERSSRPGATGGVPVGVDAVLGTRRWAMPTETSARWDSVGGDYAIVTEVGGLDHDQSPSRRWWLNGRDGGSAPVPTVSPDRTDWIAPLRGGPLAWRVVSRSSPEGSADGPQLQSLEAPEEVVVGGTSLPEDAIAAEVGSNGYLWVRLRSGRVQAFDQSGTAKSDPLTGTVNVLRVDLILITRPDSTELRLIELS